MDQSQRLVTFRLLYLVTQMVGVVIVILIVSWIGLHLEGFGWDYEKPGIIFNWHPLFMVFGMVFLYGNSILVYRGFRYGRKRSLKLTHASIHALAFFFTVYGLIAVFDSHNYAVPKIPNLYSLHSWMGLIAVAIFACQYVAGFTCYLFPMLKEPLRIFYMPIHIFFGLLGFVLAIATCLLGISEKAFFEMPKGEYGDLPSQAILVNFIGVLIALYGSLVVYLVTEPSFKREPLPEDTLLLTGNSE